MSRGFEVVSKFKDSNINIPIRKTKYSAGYDIEAAEDKIIPVFKEGVKPVLVSTGLKAYFEPNECLLLINRSSGPKKGICLANGIGLIDSDYYNNSSNEGELFFSLFNVGDKELVINKGDVIGQGLFINFLITDQDKAEGKRKGGFGSTDKL